MKDIIESIDGAIHDWQTSSDAMRWVPEEKRSWDNGLTGPLTAQWHAEGESLPVQTVGPFRLVSELHDGVLYVRIEFNAHLYAEAMQRINNAMSRMTEQFAGLTYSIDPPETLRERALRLRQERGHGPSTPLNRRRRDLP